MTKAIHQFIPTYEPSAVGAHTTRVQETLRDLGYESEIFTNLVADGMRGHARLVSDLGTDVPERPSDIILYQFAIGNKMAEDLRSRRGLIAMNYHNVTPALYWWDWEPDVAQGLEWGRTQLAGFSDVPRVSVAVSEFNADELRGLGYQDVGVAPILFDAADFASEPDPGAARRLESAGQRGGADILFVGSIAPHKCQHDIIKAFATYRREFDTHARLHLVGGATSPAYRGALDEFAQRLGLDDCVNITGGISQAELSAHYRAADLFVCLSEHEGFCVPLLEAWYHDLPIVAYAASAVPETLGDAGLLLPTKAAIPTAVAMHRAIVDSELRRELTTRGRRRLGDYSLDTSRRRFVDALLPVLEEAA